jgi:anti-sigma factor (TIGR02949 family)
MNCEKIKDQLSAYIDGEMPEEDATAIKKHIAVCADCAQEEQLLRKTSQMVRRWGDVPAPDGFCEALLVKAANMSRRPRRSFLFAVRPFAGPGAFVRVAVYGAAVLLLCVAVIFFTRLPLRKAPSVEPLPIQTEPALSALQEVDEPIAEDSPKYTTMANMKVAAIWE